MLIAVEPYADNRRGHIHVNVELFNSFRAVAVFALHDHVQVAFNTLRRSEDRNINGVSFCFVRWGLSNAVLGSGNNVSFGVSVILHKPPRKYLNSLDFLRGNPYRSSR